MRKTLNIIGCGNVGKVLGRLWAKTGTFTIQDVLNRSFESAQRAVDFIQEGRPVRNHRELQAADAYLIATPDDEIGHACQALADAGVINPGCIVFHCSGALLSTELAPAIWLGARAASVHPIRSFAVPEQTLDVFAGTYCGVEGSPEAVSLLNEAFTAIGAIPIGIEAEFKTVYHAAAVFASNYVVTLLDVALQAYVKAGIPQDEALKLVEPLVRGTVDNVFRLGTTNALTGPIARGDIATAARQYRAVKQWNEDIGLLYKQFGKLTTDIAARKRAVTTKKD